MEVYEKMAFREYTGKQEMDTSIHTLEGILKGIAIDDKINPREVAELKDWCESHRWQMNIHPYNEMIALIDKSLEDDVLVKEEYEDLLWLCRSFRTGNLFYDVITSDIQRLEGVLHGILSDNIITDEEILRLKAWLNDNEHLLGCYPYDEIYSLLTSILSDGIVSDDERKILKIFFSEFVNYEKSQIIDSEEIEELKKVITINGICAVCPEINIQSSVFCFTGASSKTTRSEIGKIIESLGGTYKDNVTKSTNYLIIGNDGNPCWAFSCYGRKVEAAVNMRKNGQKIVIVHENDFWDALVD